MPRIKEQALKADLAKRGFESVSIKRELPGGRIQVEANKLTPCMSRRASRSTRPSRCRYRLSLTRAVVSSRPAALQRLFLDARQAGDTPNPAAVTEAARYIKTLRDSGQLTSTGEQQSTGGVTHQIERDEQGRQVLRRKRFSIS